ncbi:MAG: succinyl-diaminopimelate desuccinylase [Zoogloeaceae bacterium]|jgi:succinyl-diaminopimelate desuccinylase|nr:succinyl-diaminopimelate desuccinylase [Zoogloeaceae bacterium]
MTLAERARDSVLNLARDLIACASVTPEDGGALDLIGDRLSKLGFVCERMDRGGVKNLWARRGAASPLFCFAGHVDVVPPGPLAQWRSPPFTPTIRDGFLYGRGAADMKSSVAAMMVAAENFLRDAPEIAGSLAFLLTSDEEGDARDGTAAVVERLRQRGERIDFCLVGEPTSAQTLGDMVKNGRRGSLSGKLVVFGVQSHIAYPVPGRNPVLQLAPALAELSAAKWDCGNADFPPTSWQVSNIHAGAGAGNVVPGSVELCFNFRFSPESDPESLQARFAAALEKHGVKDYRLEWTLGARPFFTSRGRLAEAMEDVLLDVTGQKTEFSATGGTSDGRFLVEISQELLEFGPVNASSHQIDEHIALTDLPRLSEIYRGLLRKLFLPDTGNNDDK